MTLWNSTTPTLHKEPPLIRDTPSLCLHRVIYRFDVIEVSCIVIIVTVIMCHC